MDILEDTPDRLVLRLNRKLPFTASIVMVGIVLAGFHSYNSLFPPSELVVVATFATALFHGVGYIFDDRTIAFAPREPTHQ